jgi:diguanylate cyclase (GGDEF)-like protein
MASTDPSLLDPGEHAAVRSLLEPGVIKAALQPVVRVRDDAVVGYEALARMPGPAGRGPDGWLAIAAACGLRDELEIACLAAAVVKGLPPDDQLLFVNLSPSLLGDARVLEVLAPVAHRVVIEVSEAEEVADYEVVGRQVADWQDLGAQLAVDDAGSGYASLRHVVRLAPNFIKLDRSLIDGVDQDRSLRALVASFVAFAREAGSSVVAEGVETRDELLTLREIGVHFVQGYFLGRPGEGWLASAPRERTLRLEGCRTITEVGDAVCEHLASPGVMPSMFMARDGLLRCVAQRGLWQVLDGLSPSSGVTGLAYRTDRMVVVDDVRNAEEYLEAIPGVIAEVCAPIRVDGVPVGSLNIDSTRALGPVDVEKVRRAAAIVGECLGSLHATADAGPLAHLAAATVRLERVATEDEIAEILLDAALRITEMSTAVLIARQADGRAPTAVIRGPLGSLLQGLAPGELGRLVDVVVPSRSCHTAGDDDAMGIIGMDVFRQAGIRSAVVVPIRPSAGEPDLLAVVSTRRRQLSTDTIELLELLAAQATARLETIRHIAVLRRRAAEDALTGVGNRAAFSEILAAWRRDATEGVVVVLDVDDFKQLNDSFGHADGDEVLVALARSLRQAVRPEDAVFRLGGDEFAVLLPGVRADERDLVRDRLQLAAATVLSPRGISVSVGVASTGPSTAVEDAVRQADRRMYDAKRMNDGRGLGGLTQAGGSPRRSPR